MSEFQIKIEKQFHQEIANGGDIAEHLQLLRDLASEVKHVTEMGVRYGSSSAAFLCEDVTLIGYDIQETPQAEAMYDAAIKEEKDVKLIIADVLKIDIDETDFLFIDTWHSNEQLRQELAIHGNKARKYLGFHDTQTYGLQDESWNKVKPNHPGAGLLPAIINFVIENPHWQFKIHRTNNNGLTILERT